MRRDQHNPLRGYGQGWAYVASGFTFAAAILAFGALGWWLDGRLGTRPLFAIAGAFIGGAAGFLRIYYQVKADTARDEGKREG